MGTPEFAVPILKSLIANDNYDVIAAVTQPDRKVGRKHILTGSPVKQAAVEAGVKVYQPEKISGSDEMAELMNLNADFIVTAAFGQFLPTKLLKSVKLAAINVHASLLPKYRGGAPVHYAILKGDQETGVSIIYMIKKMDAGDVISQARIPIEKTDDVGSMFDKLSLLGRDLLLQTMPSLIDGTATPQPQDEEKVTFAPTIKPEEEQVDINLPARLVDAKVRGLRPFPVSYVMLDGVRTKLWGVEVLDETTSLDPGHVVRRTKHELVIATGQNGVISLKKLQPAGKPQQSITDFLNGSRDKFNENEKVID